ncbi:MAG: hypothetical protein ACK5IJ_10625 [Mangrovibacterium sp.]
MKPYKAFLFIGLTLIAILIALHYQGHLKWNANAFFMPPIPDNTSEIPIDLAIEELHEDTVRTDSLLSDSLSLALKVDSMKVVTPQKKQDANESKDFPYDDISSKIRASETSTFLNLRKIFQKSSSESTRIFLFGDSQLEGDFLAAALREKLQPIYGGNAPGLLAADNYFSEQHQLVVSLSKNWTQSERMKIKKGNQSILFRQASIENSSAWIRITRTKSFQLKDSYTQFQFFVVSQSKSRVVITNENDTIGDYALDGSLEVQSICLEFDQTPSDLKISVEAQGNFEVECLSLDARSGIFVDNIPLRGKISPQFSISDSTAIKKMFDLIDPDFFIFQFGANLIKYADDQTIAIYRKQSIQQIKLLQRWHPNVPILIMSISDIAHKTSDGVQSYSVIPKLKSIQYEIAMQYHCAFWDLDYYIQEEGGIINWTKSSPALARNDYLHFTRYGARKVGLKLADLILSEFDTTLILTNDIDSIRESNVPL